MEDLQANVLMYFWVWIAVALAIIAGVVLLTHHPRWRDYLAYGVILGGLAVAYIILHPRQTPLMNDAKAVQAMIGTGKPVLLEFQSPY